MSNFLTSFFLFFPQKHFANTHPIHSFYVSQPKTTSYPIPYSYYSRVIIWLYPPLLYITMLHSMQIQINLIPNIFIPHKYKVDRHVHFYPMAWGHVLAWLNTLYNNKCWCAWLHCCGSLHLHPVKIQRYLWPMTIRNCIENRRKTLYCWCKRFKMGTKWNGHLIDV